MTSKSQEFNVPAITHRKSEERRLLAITGLYTGANLLRPFADLLTDGKYGVFDGDPVVLRLGEALRRKAEIQKMAEEENLSIALHSMAPMAIEQTFFPDADENASNIIAAIDTTEPTGLVDLGIGAAKIGLVTDAHERKHNGGLPASFDDTIGVLWKDKNTLRPALFDTRKFSSMDTIIDKSPGFAGVYLAGQSESEYPFQNEERLSEFQEQMRDLGRVAVTEMIPGTHNTILLHPERVASQVAAAWEEIMARR